LFAYLVSFETAYKIVLEEHTLLHFAISRLIKHFEAAFFFWQRRARKKLLSVNKGKVFKMETFFVI